MSNIDANIEFQRQFLFQEFSCMNCKQRMAMPEGALQFFSNVTDLWKFAKIEHRKAPVTCVKPELIVLHSVVLVSASLLKPVLFDDIISDTIKR